jgi:hypothetical protein
MKQKNKASSLAGNKFKSYDILLKYQNVTPESPLMASCAGYLRFKDIDLNFVDVIQLFVLALLQLSSTQVHTSRCHKKKKLLRALIRFSLEKRARIIFYGRA